MARILTLITRFALSALLGAALAASPFPVARAADSISEQDAHSIGVTAYLYLYSLVTMDVTAAADQCRQASRSCRTDEYVHKPSRIPAGGHEGRGPAELRHAVFQRMARPDQGRGDQPIL